MMELDRSRLLLGFKCPHTCASVKNLLQGSGFILEDSPDQSDRTAFLPGERVHHTEQRVWVRTPGNKPVNQRMWNALGSRTIQTRLEWIGPVYRLPETTGRRGLLCPLPNTLVIKPTQPATVVIANSLETLTQKMRRLGLEEVSGQEAACAFRAYRLKQPKKHSAYSLYTHLWNNARESVEFVDFDYMPLLDSIASGGLRAPTGRLYEQQWNLTQIGAPGGWGITTGSRAVVVAVIDRGCDLTHPRLQAAYTKTGATVSGSSIDPGGQSVNSSHGTYCAGIIAAEWKDHCVAGLAPDCAILPIRLQTETSQELARAIEYATNQHVQVISISLADNGFESPSVRDAIRTAAGQNIVICAATGNTNGSSIAYPASDPSVIACGAFSLDGKHAEMRCDETVWGTGWGSNYGMGLSVMAPGDHIITTQNNESGSVDGDYTMDFWGTSSATPHVAALAALIISVYMSAGKPYTSHDVRGIIESTAAPLPAPPYQYNHNDPTGIPYLYPWDRETGYGRISVDGALQKARTRVGGP